MKSGELKSAFESAVAAALAAGEVMRKNLLKPKKINASFKHDIKLDLDVKCQELITRRLARAFPDIPLLGEEGITEAANQEYRWVVDPIDGTVNFTYGIPHACVSIALQQAGAAGKIADPHAYSDGFRTVAGVVYDPFCKELWTAQLGQPARMNGRRISVSKRAQLSEAIVAIGFAKHASTAKKMERILYRLIYKARKVRITGSAALSLVWVAAGRFDGYREFGVRIWDIAAGGLIIEQAGGEFWRQLVGKDHTYSIIANNGLLRAKIDPEYR